jgi:hypothetical protein
LQPLRCCSVDALEAMGIAVRQKEDKGFFITCKSTNPIRAYDKDGDVIDGISIGNGSKGIAMIGFMSGTGRKGRDFSFS